MKKMKERAQWPRWSPDDDAVMRAKFGKVMPCKLAEFLGRTRWAVIERAQILRLTKKSAPVDRDWESVQEACARHGMEKKAMRLRLQRAGVRHGRADGVQIRVPRAEVNRAVRQWRRKSHVVVALAQVIRCQNCDETPLARGLCAHHYQQAYRKSRARQPVAVLEN